MLKKNETIVVRMCFCDYMEEDLDFNIYKRNRISASKINQHIYHTIYIISTTLLNSINCICF